MPSRPASGRGKALPASPSELVPEGRPGRPGIESCGKWTARARRPRAFWRLLRLLPEKSPAFSASDPHRVSFFKLGNDDLSGHLFEGLLRTFGESKPVELRRARTRSIDNRVLRVFF